MPKSTRDRFFSKVRKTSGCWRWTASTDNHGYGQLRIGGAAGRPEKAHRLSWMIHHGPIPKGMCVCHRCDNRLCVNPAHLFIGTRADNNRDMAHKGRSPHGENHCHAKLTALDVRAIRASNEPARALASKYGVDHTSISNARTRRTWGHVA